MNTIKNMKVLLAESPKTIGMRKIFTIIALFVAVAATAQKARFDIRFVSETPEVTKVLVHPLNINEETKSVVMREKDGHFVGTVQASGTGFYNLVVVRNQSQLMVPVYALNDKEVKLDVRFEGKDCVVDNCLNNKVMTSLNSELNNLDRRLWLESNLTGEQLKDMNRVNQ